MKLENWTRLWIVAIALFHLAQPSSAQSGGRVSPEASTLMPADALGSLFMTPGSPIIDPAIRNVLTLRNEDGEPMRGVEVEIILAEELCVCSDAVLSGVTGEDGAFEFITAGGGYRDFGATVVTGDGTVIREYTVKSPDFDGAGGDCIVNLMDLVALSGCLGSSCIEFFDFDNDGDFGLGDLVLYGRSFSLHMSCP